MDTSALKKFAQAARRQLLEQVAARMEQVLGSDSVEIREKEKAVKELREEISEEGKESVIDTVAYTWFNRFCALRFMDVNHYTRVGTVTPVHNYTQPEILGDAKQGIIDAHNQADHARVFALLNGQIPSSNPQQEAYRLLLKGACNAWHAEMPFLFPEIEDYTELLMPDDLLSENSVLHSMRQALNEAACQDVEVIGWLYQYYISERKDEVFAGLKKRKKIEAEDIPAATQLFTPHWIVRYLVENSLGRLWMLNNPESKLAEGMDYYIAPEEEESDFLEIASPEEIKFCDPACGSGHILTYAFDLLYAIYEEQGYDPLAIPSLILKDNIYGIEIDERAGNLAAFALTMKARAVDRRFFKRNVEPNLCVLENVRFTASEIDEYMDVVGRDLFTQDLWQTLRQFEQAENFGSLIRPALKDISFVRDRLEEKGIFENLFLHDTNKRVKRVLEMAEYLSSRYHVVVANPPYMGLGGINDSLSTFAKERYPNSKTDLFSMFIDCNLELAIKYGYVGMITMQSWMFLSSYNTLREAIIKTKNIITLAHLGARAFDSIGGEVVSTAAFVIKNATGNAKGFYFRLLDGNNETKKKELFLRALQKAKDTPIGISYISSPEKFSKIPNSILAYWVSDRFVAAFDNGKKIGETIPIKSGMSTTDNKRFLRFWTEVSQSSMGFDFSSIEEAKISEKKWFPFKKGGSYRKWYGNNEIVLNWYKDGKEIKEAVVNNPSDPNTTHWSRRIFGVDYFFTSGITWTKISTSKFSCRFHDQGYIFSDASNGAFPSNNIHFYLSFLNSKVSDLYLEVLSPTLNFKAGDISKIPVLELSQIQIDNISCNANLLTKTSKKDWDSSETSWGFTSFLLLGQKIAQKSLAQSYAALRKSWAETIVEMKELEEESNQIFIEAYKLEEELTPDVSLDEITLTCNPHYRYKGNKSEEELEALLLEDTMQEFISYAVGCMFGRYSLDKPGLILANAGETQEDYLRQVPEPSFMPDDDNVIPILAGEWFEDDIAERFKQFLKVTFGKEHYEENLAFIEDAIGKDIRAYFVKDFYKNHVKMYKKRPIYWQFSSSKGSFNALIYMHRYRPDTVSIILNGYLRQYREKVTAQKAHLQAVERDPNASQGEKAKALREIDKINNILAELKEYENDVLYPLATQQIEIDLDDGVKINYPKFGQALKKVAGLS